MGLRPQSRPEAEGQTAQALHRPFIKLEGERWEDSRPRLQVKPAALRQESTCVRLGLGLVT